MKMICFNGTNGTASDSNQESISSPISSSLSSSPVKSQTIKDLLESPIINRSQNIYSDEEIIVAESPEHDSFDGLSNGHNHYFESNDNEDEESIKEVPMTQELDLISIQETSIDRSKARNLLKRQTSICVNTNITSSPRALAILKNAIKTSNNYNNSNCDKNNDNNQESNGETNSFSVKNHYFNNNIINGTNSPPNLKMFGKSPFSRGSALLRAAKERISKEYGTPPKTDMNSMSNSMKDSPKLISNDLYSDKQLISILRKHELQSSPTSGEPKAKKKKVLFAEPVVSSELEFDCSPLFGSQLIRQIRSVESVENDLKSIETQLNESSDRKRNNLVHQDSTFQDNACDSNDSDSPLLITQYFKEAVDPVCYENSNLDDDSVTNNQINCVRTSNAELVPDSYNLDDSGIPLITEDISEISSSDEAYPCSQPMPVITTNDEHSRNNNQNCATLDYLPTDENQDEDEDEEDLIVNVPMRLSLIKELYNLFGTIIEQYSDT